MSEQDSRLWTTDDLAAFLGLSPKTVTTLSSRDPDRLPPRVQALSSPRWVPSVCHAWVTRHSGQPIKRRAGRPRRVV